MSIFEKIDRIFRAFFVRARMLYYKMRLGWGVSVGGPIKIFGSSKSIILKGKAGINAFCVIGAKDDAKIIIGDDVSISPGSVIVSYGLDISVLDKKRPHKSYGDIILEDHVWVCSNITIAGGVRVGKNSVIAAGSVVSKDVPPDCVVGGVPAKVIKKLR